MRITPGDTNSQILSKKLSFILRNGKRHLRELTIDDNGWVEASEILQ